MVTNGVVRFAECRSNKVERKLTGRFASERFGSTTDVIGYGWVAKRREVYGLVTKRIL